MSWLCGQEPTLTNAQAIIARLHRRAVLQPTQAVSLLAEANVIREMLQANALPEGFVPSTPPVDTPRQRPKTARPVYGPWHFLYKALSNRQPPVTPHDSKIAARWGQSYFLRSDGRLTMGHSLRRSMPLARGQREALIEQGRQRLAPQVATLDDVKEIFS